MMQYLGVETNLEKKAKAEVDLVVTYETASTMESHTIRATAQHMAKNAKSVGKTITLRQCVKVINVMLVLIDISQKRQREKVP